MPKIKVAIACQGGGSQTAFTAGALKALMEFAGRGEHDFEVARISGTSGGALRAALACYSSMKGDSPRWRRLIEFWQDKTAHNWMEEAFNEFVVQYIRSARGGLWPAFPLGPTPRQSSRQCNRGSPP